MALTKLSVQDQHQLGVDTNDGRGWHCLRGPQSGDLLTLGGKLVVHHTAQELHVLVPGAQVVPVPPSAKGGPFLPISAHPQFRAVRSWDPIDPEEFRA